MQLGDMTISVTDLSSVERAPINVDGSLGSWQVVSNMTKGRYGHAAVAVDGYLYVLGGYTGTWDATVERAAINSDGSLGPWQLTSTMTSPREALAAVYLERVHLCNRRPRLWLLLAKQRRTRSSKCRWQLGSMAACSLHGHCAFLSWCSSRWRVSIRHWWVQLE